MNKPKAIGKKELKKFINENGFFYSMTIDLKKNAPDAYATQIPEGATYFEGVVSNGELNRNGYIIRPQALINSLADFMLNPVILLQHETDEPIGHCLSAEARGSGSTQEVFVRGYIYDDLTEGRFGRGLFRGLSTGHIPQEVEFENSKTGQVISEEDFRKFNWEEQMNGDWIMCVTKLEWVEFSLVAIGSVRKALITAKNSIQAFLNNKKISENSVRGIVGNEAEEGEEEKEGEEKPAEETPAPEAKTEEEGQPNEDSKPPVEGEDSENAGETPAASTDEPAEKSGEGEGESSGEQVEGNKIRISKADRERLQNAANVLVKTLEATMADEEETKEEPKAESEQKAEDKPADEQPAGEAKVEESKEVQGAEQNSAQPIQVAPEIKAALQALVDLNFTLEGKVRTLEAKLAKVPVKRGLSITSQFNTPTEKPKQSASEALVTMLRANGFAV